MVYARRSADRTVFVHRSANHLQINRRIHRKERKIPLKTNMTGWKVNILQLEIHLKIWFLPFVMLGNSGVDCKYLW